MVSWSSWLWHLLNTQNVPSPTLSEIIPFLLDSNRFLRCSQHCDSCLVEAAL
ncbi:hypothetical protein BABINDRAFT_159983 [Babjeviella inositovora NRRL Y-12698]|uniref:Uncharacterized protein n=1 Tax=Babjeviella inositovora NRRL Y-12698 TaxID=984486 RepID=A0A1E3QVP6_9ASCO|nr:uncharacterized protein BABINDRAFT_159983 [Babjeviella inositovora NRRL Y-12698]ODQ81736.1 hypothetical protein BABINDRAFT_159983 [Babjeviella inositovora NRRL Y-12698]